MSTALWIVLLAAAVLWPAHPAGLLDGAPLDTAADAILIGLALPMLIAIDRRILRAWSFRILILTLLAWKTVAAGALVQDGWCLRFTSPVPLFVGDVRVPHAWDVRADWRSEVPRCSAVMTRGYPEIERFPVFFFNLPPANFNEPAKAGDRPPQATVAIDVNGFLTTTDSGTFRVGMDSGVTLAGTIDGMAVDQSALQNGVTLQGGTHAVALSGSMTSERWVLLPQWNGADVWQSALATMEPPRAIDRWSHALTRWVPAALVSSLLLFGVARLVRRVADRTTFLTSAITSAAAAATIGRNNLMRVLPLVLGVAALVRIPRRMQNIFGAQLLIGVPFLAMIVARGFDDIGRTIWYSSGDDWWVFQRYAYRIYLQGFWLEGGEPTFWFQPFYRWIAGALHLVFGDASHGELFWDGASAWAGGLFAFHVARVYAGFRWGVAGAVITLLLMTAGPGWYLFGRGLSEFTSAGLIYAAALWALRGRTSPKYVVVAGVCAAIAFYTRLNNLPFAVALVAFSLPIRQPAGDWFKWREWGPRVSRPVMAGMIIAIVGAILLFGMRTYYYTGAVNALAGTQASARSVWQPTGTGETVSQNVIGSVLLVLTMNDPARFDVRALPLMFGVAAAILALCGVRPFRRLPLNVVLMCLAGMAGAFVARGSAYPGRFSVHLIPVTVALTLCSVALLTGAARQRRTAGGAR